MPKKPSNKSPQKQNLKEEDVLKWLLDTEAENEKKTRGILGYFQKPDTSKSHTETIFTNNGLLEIQTTQTPMRHKPCGVPFEDLVSYNDLMAAQEQLKADYHQKVCEVYRRSGSIAELRKTELYRKIKECFDAVWKEAKYKPLNLADEPEVKKALAELARYIFTPPKKNGLPCHLLRIPHEAYQWLPTDIPRPGMNSWKSKQDTRDFIDVARLRKLCDPLAIDLEKRDGEGTAKSCADDYIIKLLETLDISLK